LVLETLHKNADNLLGEVFHKWTVIDFGGRNKSGNILWKCRCECGTIRNVLGTNLKRGVSKSCGLCTRSSVESLIGKRFGRWEVISKEGFNSCGQTMWLCQCECGTERIVNGSSLRTGRSNSCGCVSEGNKRHGMSGTRFYEIWSSMINRCKNKGQTAYKHYGGRGIKVCDRWKKFENFYEDMYDSYVRHVESYGEQNTTLDRIEVDGNYTPENTKWSTWSEQNLNKRIHRKEDE